MSKNSGIAPPTQLLFVYNAESGLGNALLDTGHRFLSPDSYPCALCMITYGPFGMKRGWKAFIRGLPGSVSFMHRSQFHDRFPSVSFKPPGLLRVSNGQPEILISSADFDHIHSLVELRAYVLQKL